MRSVFLLLLLAHSASGATLEQAKKLMEKKSYAQAITVLERLSQENPGSTELLMNLGWAYAQAGRRAEARKCWRLLVDLDPKNPTFLRLLADAEAEEGNNSEAVALAEKALRLAPMDVDAAFVRSKALINMGRSDEGVQALLKLSRENPNHRAVQFLLAEHFVRIGEFKEALARYNALLKAEPGNATYRRGRAGVLYELGHYDEAVAEWRSLANSNPRDVQSLQDMARAYWDTQKYDEAREIWTRLVKLEPENPVFLGLLANAELRRGEYKSAETLARKALSRSPGNLGLTLALANALIHLQRDEEALALLEDVIRDYKDDPKAKLFTADILAQLGRLEEALQYLNQLAAQDPSNTLYRKRRAQVLFEVGQFDQAIAEWTMLAGQKDPDPDSLARLMSDAVNRKAWEEALEWMRKLSEAKPLDSYSWQTLALILSKLGKNSQALKAAETAAEALPPTLEPLYFKAELLESMRELGKSQETYMRILALNPNSDRAIAGLARLAETQGDFKRALSLVKKLQKTSSDLGSSDPHLRIQEARLLADSGNLRKALQVIREVSNERLASVPALVYQGLSRFERSDAVSAGRFSEHMAALKAQGFQPVSLADIRGFLAGKGKLPERPILITFDDARRDVLDYADPVLKANGFKATVFAHLSDLQTSASYADIDELRSYRDTGRWEVQSHGSRSHDTVQTEENGARGRFLANRMLRLDPKEMETPEEFESRLEKEYEAAKAELKQAFPENKVFAFAFPYGDYGRSEISNAPEGVALNEQLARKNFDFALLQDQRGFNALGPGAFMIKRVLVNRDMDAAALKRHLALSEPRLRARILEAGLWVRNNKPGRALEIYEQLRSEGFSEPELLAQRGLALERAGNDYDARRLYARAANLNPEEERFRRLLEKSERSNWPTMGSEVRGFSDNFNREGSKALIRFDAPVRSMRFGGWAGKAAYSALGTDRVHVQEAGFQLGMFPTERTGLRLSYARLLLSQGVASSMDNFAAELTMLLRPGLKFSVQGGQETPETAPAILNGRTYGNMGLQATWDPALNWQLAARGQFRAYNDDNRGRDLLLNASRLFSRFFSLGYAYAYMGYDREVMAEYYSPERLSQHMGTLGASIPFGERGERTELPKGEAKMQYGFGYGVQGETARSVHVFRGSFGYRFFDVLSLSLGALYTQSPTYINRELNAGVGIGF